MVTLQKVQNPATVVSMVVGGAQGPRGSSTQHSKLAQPKAKDGDSVKEPDNLHEKGKGDGLVGKQEGKLTEVEVFASNCPISQVKVAESMQWEKGLGFQKKMKRREDLRLVPVGPSMLGPVVLMIKYLGSILLGRTWL